MVDRLDSDGARGASSATFAVDPGDIQAFAKFLDGVSNELDRMRAEATSLINAPDFGEYDESAASARRYAGAATRQRDYLAKLQKRSEVLVTGTKRLASQYRALEDLNATGGSTVQTTIDEA